MATTMITLHGVADSRAFRCLWMLEELGIEYQHVPVDFSGECKKPEYLELNPNGRVPCLVDGDLVLFESLAINLYLARRYGAALWPSTIADEARMLQWTLWATNELDTPLAVLTRQGRLPKEERSAALVDQAFETLGRPMRVLDKQLSVAPFLLGSVFSLADLNTASVAAAALSGRFDLGPFPHVKAWLGQCLARPAAQRTVALLMAARRS
jgi:glutathione S-transferase